MKLLRVHQYVKNLFIFAPVLFDGNLFNREAFRKTMLGFITLCLLSGSVYILNDIADRDSDRNHPKKKSRPIASGKISVRSAAAVSVLLGITALALAWGLNSRFLLLCIGILLINLAYSLVLKHWGIIDVMTIAMLFLMRVAAGAILVPVKMFSPWLYLVTFMLALFLGFGKRRAELAMMRDDSLNTRPVLDGYSIPLLDQLISIVASVTIMAYSLYTFSGPTLPGNNKMMLTIPFVIYGIFRYQSLIQMKHEGGAPEETLFSDRPLQLAIILYALAVIYALYL